MPIFAIEQVIAARAFLDWSKRELSAASGLPFETVQDFERAKQAAAVSSFHDAGVDFLKHGDRVGVTIVMPWQDE
jgi:hypothetical protein